MLSFVIVSTDLDRTLVGNWLDVEGWDDSVR